MEGETILQDLLTVVEWLDDGLLILDREWHFVFVNPAAEQLFGCERAQLLGKQFWNVVPELRSSATFVHLQRALAEQIPVTFVEPALVTDVLFEVHALPTCTGLAVRLRSSTLLPDAARQLSFLAEAGRELASSLDYEVTLQNVARLSVPVLGDWVVVDEVAPDTSVRRVAVAHIDSDKSELLWELQREYPFEPSRSHGAAEVLRTGRAQIFPEVSAHERDRLARDARHRTILERLGTRSAIILPLTARERTLGTLSFGMAESGRRYTLRDMDFASELAHRAALAIDNAWLYREAQQALQQHKETVALLDTLMETAPVGLAFWDIRLRCVRINQFLSALTSNPVIEHFGHVLADVLPDMAAEMEPVLLRVLATGEAITGMEISSKASPGSDQQRYWLGSYYPVRAPDGQLLGVGTVVTDVTERRQAEEAVRHSLVLQQIDRLKSEFIANVSHEIRTPLHHILGYALIVLNPLLQLERAEVQDYVQIITEEAWKLERLIGDLLDTSLIESGRLRLVIEMVDLRKVLEETVRRWQKMGTHEFDLELPSSLPPVPIDVRRIDQVVNNLLANIIKYTPDQTRTMINMWSTPTEVIVSVRDNGPGIPAEHHPFLFDRFYQAPMTGHQSRRGSGLGLFISKAIITQHGGRIWVEQTPGGGATFSFSLPRQHSAGTA